jgi:hypothetical protein
MLSKEADLHRGQEGKPDELAKHAIDKGSQ